jgi:hypothetical protein
VRIRWPAVPLFITINQFLRPYFQNRCENVSAETSDYVERTSLRSNEFLWPGPDLRAIPGRDESTIAYGALPPRFFVHVRERFRERDRSEKKSMRVARTE